MSTDALLEAGAVLPAGAATGTSTMDTLTARAYRHPALGDQTIVRLVPGTLGPAEDLTMEFLGFAAPEAVAEVGVVRQQALGFPAWALVNDPANGHHALALVKEIERLTRVAKSQIGPARDSFVALGERLARSVPHFLPTYYEQAGRAFLAADSPSYAAIMFGKAREAERQYGLTVDEDRQHAVFLEFALAGALTAKALAGYARELASRSDPDTAYQRFRRLCVERTLGGLPPYASIYTDLRRLAKAAKLGEAEEEALLTELLTAPSLLRAPAAFWAAYRPALVRLARRDPSVRGQLLGMFPKSCPTADWLCVLDESGATAALTEPAGEAPTEAQSPDGPAGWLERLDRHLEGYRRKRSPELLALVERMAGRLRADGVPVALCRANDYIDLDLVDACLALGVPLAEVSDNIYARVDGWLDDKTEGRRDLVEVARDERLRARLAAGIEKFLRPAVVAAVVAVPGLRSVLHWWLDQLADQVVREGLPTLGEQLKRLSLVACPEGLAVNPDAVRRIREHRLGPVLGAALRAGVLDEYGWPELESAVATLTGPALDQGGDDDDTSKIELHTQWPQLVLRRGAQVVVVGPDGVELEHVLRIPAGQERWSGYTVLGYAGGQLLVSWYHDERVGYWSGTPDDVFTTTSTSAFGGITASVALPGGGRTAGGRPFSAGDRSIEARGNVATDGRHHWVLWRPEGEPLCWQEYDVATGELGRVSLPSFFESGAVDGQPLRLYHCQLLAAGPRLAASPLGYRDGLVGWRMRDTPGDGQAGESVDGRHLSLAGPDPSDPLVGAIRFPGSAAPLGVVLDESWRGQEITLYTTGGARVAVVHVGGRGNPFAAGSPVVPPLEYWHYLQPRDEAGSAALRSFTDHRAGRLLAAVAELSVASQPGQARTATPELDTVSTLVAEALPEISHPALLRGIAGIVQLAVRLAQRLAHLSATVATIAATPPQQAAVDDRPGDAVLNAALDALIPRCYDHGHEAVDLYQRIGPVLTGHQPEKPIAELAGGVDHDWFDVLGVLPAIMLRAVAPGTTAEHRVALLDLLEIVAGSGLLAGRVRRLTLRSETVPPKVRKGDVLDLDGRWLVVFRVDKSDGDVRAVEFSANGRFGPVPGYRINGEQVLDPRRVDAHRVTEFVSLARERGPLPWRPEQVRAVSGAAGISLAEASMLLGCPDDEDARRQIDPTVSAAAVRLAAEHRRDHPVLSPRDGAYLAMLPDDLSTLWTDGVALERLAEWAAKRVGARTPVSDDLIVAFEDAAIATVLGASEFLHGIANPQTCRWLAGPVSGVDEADLLVTIARAVPWLVRRLPASHPVRVALPQVVELVRRWLRDPEFAVRFGDSHDQEWVDKFVQGLAVPLRSDGTRVDAGLFYTELRRWCQIYLRPARLSSPEDPLLAALVATFGSPPVAAALRVLLGGQLAAWLEAAAQTDPVGAEGAEHDPSRSAPELVAEVAQQYGIGADAATLYLQLLALPDPTDRNLKAWTGWKPARFKSAYSELAGTDLVVEAKRPRSGRSLFLPGGWLALKAPHLPLEEWKLPLLLGGEVNSLGSGPIPVAPPPRLFALAWDRITGGDAPRFAELTTGGRR